MSRRSWIVVSLIALGLLVASCGRSDDSATLIRATVPKPTPTFAPKPTFTSAPSGTPAGVATAEPVSPDMPAPADTVVAKPTELTTPTPLTAVNAVVQVERLNVREGPGTNYQIINEVSAGEELTVTGKNEDGTWLQIQTHQIETGWVFADLVEVDTADLSHVAVAEAPPEPTPTPAPTSPPLPPPPPQKSLRMNSPEYAVQAFLWWRPEIAERDLLTVKDMGFTWVKQTFAWRDIELEKGRFDWSHTDHIVYTANKYGGLDLLIRVDDAPEWAAPGCKNPGAGIIQGPPRNLQDFADFLQALAGRYKGRIRAYEIWNEPNLRREWCGRTPSPAEYAQMLKVAYGAIKAVDPNAMVISAGLTPTGTGPPEALPDTTYLDQLYQAMGGSGDGYFDVLGVHAPGYKAPPEMSPDEAANNPDYGGQRFFVFRRVEDLRAIMERYDDDAKQVAVLEFGWTSDPVHEAYAWHRVSEEQKADYMVRAYQWAAERWAPWIGVMSAIYIADPDWTQEDEQYWWAITNPDGTSRPAFTALKQMPR